MPKRIQMSRQRPWRAENPDAVIVARPSKWGNPFIIRRVTANEWAVGVKAFGGEVFAGAEPTRTEAAAIVVKLYREWLSEHPVDLDQLHGRDLACWCPLRPAVSRRRPTRTRERARRARGCRLTHEPTQPGTELHPGDSDAPTGRTAEEA